MRDSRLGGLQAKLNAEDQHDFRRLFCILSPTWMRPKKKKTTCFFINDAFRKVRLTTD